MNAAITMESLARPFLAEMASYNWELWLEYDGANAANPGRYAEKIRAFADYLSAVPGIAFKLDRDPDNRTYGGITINGECFILDFYKERQRYLDQYHPGEKAVDPRERKAAPVDLSDVPFPAEWEPSKE